TAMKPPVMISNRLPSTIRPTPTPGRRSPAGGGTGRPSSIFAGGSGDAAGGPILALMPHTIRARPTTPSITKSSIRSRYHAGSRGRQQRPRDRAGAVDARGEPDRAAVAIDHPAHDAQAQAGALPGLARRGPAVAARERLRRHAA